MLALSSEAPRATRARVCAALVGRAFVRADLPREVVGRALGGREPAKMLLLSPTYRRDVVEGASSPSVGLWLPVERLATSGAAHRSTKESHVPRGPLKPFWGFGVGYLRSRLLEPPRNGLTGHV